MTTSINGWPIIPADTVKDRTWKMPLITGRVRKKSVWVILRRFIALFDDLVEPVDRAQSWGWAYRKIKGYGATTKWSNHASGTAVDLNAKLHPQGRRGTFTAAQQRAIGELLDRFDGLIRWGRVFEKPDEMHFEIDPKATKRQVQEMACRIVQRALVDAGYNLGTSGPGRDGVDGQRGARTTAAIKAVQRKAGLPPTGTDTPATWVAILATQTTPTDLN